ncbi:protein of unknown function DUF1816 [Stanieria cyanosphaera PCC 7437]|uniref:DUF1816 domain-containing protein n=1 Tax=Stanieria cyanosphaera (strain ATCC 29371 / PCC 7437) TaxID=111780 RepID=K9XZL4_STAC7|nr:DUF1816 domain-containing protein [Stanieria cyanosphaera]AFZ37092.1 protein of unknown function DUF1816 [Stanieria cyanosphaera PCC 7437]
MTLKKLPKVPSAIYLLFNNITNAVKKLLIFLIIPKPQLPWWVKIETTIPRCTYFFGPFDNLLEAKLFQPGYVQDLEEEQAQGITVKIEQRNVTQLTIIEEEEEYF